MTTAAEGQKTTMARRPGSGKRAALIFVSRYGTIIGLLAMIVFFSIAAPTTFPTMANFLNILSQASLTAIIAAGLTALFGEFDSSAGEVARDLNDFPIARLLFALAVGFGAPIVEELCYRGLLMTSLLKRGMSRWLSVIVSAALFAAMHLEPVRFALLFAIGLILGWARVHRNNTTTSIVAHMTNNMPGAIGILFLL